MEEQFVPYELALKLKELGFDDECLATYWKDKEFSRNPSHNMEDLPIEGRPYTWSNSKIHANNCAAPLWQQAFDWFSEFYKINNFVTRCPRGIWSFEIFRDVYSDCWEIYFNTKEEARQACLEKLIELVENEK